MGAMNRARYLLPIIYVLAIILAALMARDAHAAHPGQHKMTARQAQAWEKLRPVFERCKHAKGATAQHACAAEYASLSLELFGSTRK